MAFIDAKEVKIRALLSNAQEAYKVPIYQRPYAWNSNQWEDLFDDIINLSPNDTHFLGSIVVVPDIHKLGLNYFQVVDGQQRLATILIWLSFLRDDAKEKGNTSLANHISETFLFAKEWQNGKEVKIPKLGLGKLDNDTFLCVLEGGVKDYEHLIFECYNFFREKTKTDIWQKVLDNISVVHINAFNHFNAFRLFETLNDRGLDLSAADLMKNFLLMKVSGNEAIFEKTISEWNEMYEKVQDHEPVKFIRRYVLSNYKGKVSETRLYEEIRKKLEKENLEEVLNFTCDLNLKATVYKKIYEMSFSSAKINKTLQELHLVEVAPSYTLLLKVLPYFEENKISEGDVLEIMKMIEIFHLRWGICGQSTSQLDHIYNDISVRLFKISPDNFVNDIKIALEKEIKSKVNDEIFKRSFISRPFKPTEARTKYILWKLSTPTGETILNIRDIQTEHILAQTPSKVWIDYLQNKTSRSESEILALWRENIDKIGNLAIIKGEWNQSMSNSLFDEKKKDYEKSEFVRTKELKDYEKWTFDEINERCEKLAKIAIDIWKWEWSQQKLDENQEIEFEDFSID